MGHRIYFAVQVVLIGALVWSVMTRPGPSLLPDSPRGLAIQHGFTVAALILIGIAFIIALAAFAALGRFVRIGPAPATGSRLVDRGIYHWLRHPMYTAMVLLVLGLMLRRPVVGVVASGCAVIVFYLIKARYEERLLLRSFPEYAAYRRRTRGVLPPFQ